MNTQPQGAPPVPRPPSIVEVARRPMRDGKARSWSHAIELTRQTQSNR
jgi:hypothetical protein